MDEHDFPQEFFQREVSGRPPTWDGSRDFKSRLELGRNCEFVALIFWAGGFRVLGVSRAREHKPNKQPENRETSLSFTANSDRLVPDCSDCISESSDRRASASWKKMFRIIDCFDHFRNLVGNGQRIDGFLDT
jgi:hypothetical protein